MNAPQIDGRTRRVALARLSEWIHRTDGPMTRELRLSPDHGGRGMVPTRIAATPATTSVCGYCSTGCGLRLHAEQGQAVGITPADHYPVNRGVACPKGWEALGVLDAADRATMPMLRDDQGSLREVDWDTALRTFVDRFKSIQAEHGPHSIAFLSTGQIACEEMAMLGMLSKFVMGMVHGDGNTRQCMATAVAAYKEAFGFDAPPYTYEDFEASDCLVFIGANPCVAHPILWERVLANRNNPEILVVDPRRTETASAASRHLRLRPKTDMVLMYAIAAEIIRRGWVDEAFVSAHTVGYERLAEMVAPYTLRHAVDITGVPARDIEHAARCIGTGSAVSLWWTMGVNQSYQGTRTAQAIINLALLTGNIGRPGTGANSITGQCNAMGSRLWSNTTNLLGHHRFDAEADREKVAREVGVSTDCIPTTAGWTYDQIMNGIRRREIRGLWVIATNPAHSWIHQGEAREILESLDFLVVQDMYSTTETARQASLLLPAAGWGEKEGTFINSERRYGLIQKVRRAPGQALADFHIFRAIGQYWGAGEWFTRLREPEQVFRLMQRLSRDQPCDITGIDGYREIDLRGGVQWPWSEADASAVERYQVHRRLFADGRFYHADGKARMVVEEPTHLPEPPDDQYPILLITGRGSASQWHTQTRTAKSPVLRKLSPQRAYVEVNPDDADRLDLQPGSLVEVRSRRGAVRVRVWITATVSPGQAFMPMHYDETNQLTLPHFDPYSRQPSYKDCAVSIRGLPREGEVR